MRILLVILVCMTFGLGANAQSKCPDMPKEFSWNTAADYQRDRALVKDVLQWLCKTPMGLDIQKRGEANYFVMQWLSGTPEFTLDFSTQILPFAKDDESLLSPIIHGMALYVMDHPSEKDQVKLHVKGLETLARLVEQSEELSENKELKPMMKAYRKGKIKEYAQQNLAQTKGNSH